MAIVYFLSADSATVRKWNGCTVLQCILPTVERAKALELEHPIKFEGKINDLVKCPGSRACPRSR